MSSKSIRYQCARSHSAKAAIAALDDTAYVRMAAKRNSGDRQEFMNQVNASMNARHRFSCKCRAPQSSPPRERSPSHLEKNYVLAPRFPRWDNYIRVSLGTPAEMQEFWRVCKMEK